LAVVGRVGINFFWESRWVVKSLLCARANGSGRGDVVSGLGEKQLLPAAE